MKISLKKVLPVSSVLAILAMVCIACESQPSSAAQSPLAAQSPSVTQSPSGASDQVQGREWKLVGVVAGGIDTGYSRDKLETDFAQAYTLRFHEGLAAGRGAPNAYRAPYQQGPDKSLSLGLIAATLMAPLREPEGLKEREYFGYLSKAYHWDIKDGKLELLTKSEDGKDVVLVYSE